MNLPRATKFRLGIAVFFISSLPMQSLILMEIYKFAYLPSSPNILLSKLMLSQPLTSRILNIYWCGDRELHFTFNHYVGLKSAEAALEPFVINFYFYEKLPQLDELGYNTWFNELRQSYHNLIVEQIEHRPEICSENRSSAILFNETTGFHMLPNVIVNFDLDHNITTTLKCPAVATADLSNQLPKCFSVTEDLYPFQFFEVGSNLAKFVRQTAYGTESSLNLLPSPESLVPLICHYIWLGGGRVEFLLYLSILSCLNVLKVDSVLVHGDQEPKGSFWEELLKKYPGRVVHLHRPLQKTVYGRPINKLSPMSDVLRLDILTKFGGIYTDWDAVWVKPLGHLRQYETVASYDWPGHLKPYPDTLNLGVMLAKPNARFPKLLLESLAEDFVDGVGPNLWCYICLKAYKIYEKYPSTVRLDRHLQVIAYQGYYHPAWLENFKEVKFEAPEGSFNWKRGDAWAVHWTWPTPLELRAWKFLGSSNSTAAQIAKFIAHASD